MNAIAPLKTESATKPIVLYLRVSTKSQGDSGLGLEAQRNQLERFARENRFEPIAVFSEVETGKGSDAIEKRPHSAQRSSPLVSINAPLRSPSSIG